MFRFKQFAVRQDRCPMKVGTDGVLLGAWAEVRPGDRRMLDVGTGTGLIALMLAQRSAAWITAVDIDVECATQAAENFAASPWADRLDAVSVAVQRYDPVEKFDLIVSNPPYYVDSLLSPDEGRNTARHAAGLPFGELAAAVVRLLSPGGRFALVLPPVEMQRFRSAALGRLYPVRWTEVCSTPRRGVRRILAEFCTTPVPAPEPARLIIELGGPDSYTEDYRRLREHNVKYSYACKKIGFADMVEVGLGGDMTAAAEAAEWLEAHEQGKKMTTSCCPAFVNMIRKHYPELADNISTTVSPMCAVSRMLKAKDPGTVTVFVGPCIAKKSEVKDNDIEGNADYVLTIGEFRAMMRAKDVQFEPEENDSQQASVYGKRFGNGGGVTAAVLKSMEETGTDTSGLTVEKCAGAAEVKKALTLMKVGRLQADFVEGMMCEGGCVGGPSQHRSEMQFKKDRDTLIAEADDRGVHENLESVDMEAFAMHR